MPLPAPLTPVADLQAVGESMMLEWRIFQKRLNYIEKKLDQDVLPARPVSKDHTRTNRNGVSLERAEQLGEQKKHAASLKNSEQKLGLRKERKSVDVGALVSQASHNDMKRRVLARGASNWRLGKAGPSLGQR